MRQSLFPVSVLVFSSLGSCFAQQKFQYPFQDPSLPAEKRIDNILSLMTIDEKIDCLGVPTGVPRLGIPSYGDQREFTE